MSREARRASLIRSVDDARYMAERRLPRPVRDYVRGGSGTRRTLESNTTAFGEITFLPRVAAGATSPDLRTEVLGHRLGLPVMIAPTGGSRLVHPDGDVAAAIAAGRFTTMPWISSFTGTPVEEVTASASGPVGFQLYYPGSRDAAGALIERVDAAGCAALALTVDSAVGPRPEVPLRGRVTNYRAGATGRRPLAEYARIARYFGSKPRWVTAFLRDRAAGLNAGMVAEGGRPTRLFRASELLTRQPPVWADIAWIRERWSKPIVIKGILTPRDARRAVDHGADAIVVSNHGGNVLDGTPPAVRMLPGIVDAVGGQIEVFLDSGIRRGSDVAKALALGATAVQVGRSWLWGLAAAGEPGVRAVLDVYRQQIGEALLQLGCSSIGELDRSLVAIPPDWLEAPG